MLYHASFIIPLLVAFVVSQNSNNCVCVSYFLCSSNGTVITDGAGIIDERFGQTSPCPPKCNCTGLDVCCALPANISTIRALTPDEPLKKNSLCGKRNPDGVGFRISKEGSETELGEFPWMLQIYEDGKYRCGASLIHPSVALTAAHCVREPNAVYTVRAGEWDTAATSENLKHQDRNVASVKTHEDYGRRNYFNDVALVFLDKPFDLAPHVQLVCLVPEAKSLGKSECVATGWGKAQFGGEQNISTVLKKVELGMVGHGKCQEQLRETRLGKYFNLHQSFVCAGGEKDKDTCTGDGGGPLVCPIEGEEDRYQQVGITSWGIGCNDENVPAVYANVADLRTWIDKQMKEKTLDTQGYQ